MKKIGRGSTIGAGGASSGGVRSAAGGAGVAAGKSVIVTAGSPAQALNPPALKAAAARTRSPLFVTRKSGKAARGGGVIAGGGSNNPSTKIVGTVLLMHFDGTDGSTTFTDSSLVSTHFSVDIGSPTISTTQSKFGGAAYKGNIAAGPGTQSGIIGNSSNYDLFDSDFTIEFFAFFLNNFSASSWISFGTGQPTGTNDFSSLPSPRRFDIACDAVGTVLVFYRNDAGTNAAGTFSNSFMTPNTWVHIAIVRSANILYCFAGGVKDTVNYPGLSTTAYSGMTYCSIGGGRASGASQKYVQGYMDELRVSNIAVYSSSFTPPSAPFTS